MFVCLFVLGIRDDFIWLPGPKTSDTFDLGWHKYAVGDARLQAFVSGQEAEEEVSHLYYTVTTLFPICLHVREPV